MRTPEMSPSLLYSRTQTQTHTQTHTRVCLCVCVCVCVCLCLCVMRGHGETAHAQGKDGSKLNWRVAHSAAGQIDPAVYFYFFFTSHTSGKMFAFTHGMCPLHIYHKQGGIKTEKNQSNRSVDTFNTRKYSLFVHSPITLNMCQIHRKQYDHAQFDEGYYQGGFGVTERLNWKSVGLEIQRTEARIPSGAQ